MKSIRQSLVRTLSLTISGLVFGILLATDIAVDSWFEAEFTRALKAKSGMLMTLIDEDEDGVEFEFSGEFMPEFEGRTEPEYFQLWYEGETFERSDSLNLFKQKDLPFEQLKLGEVKIASVTLPDGRDGKVIYTHFIPQVDTEDRATFFENQTTVQSPMTLAYAASAEELNFILWLIDFVFVTTTIAVVIFIRLFVSKSVDTSLRPLNKLNNDISQLSIAQKGAKVTLDEPISELVPMVESLNSFIDENRQLFLREKRLTSDIAHELKTPIAELINLSQVVIRFPGNKELEEDFTPEVLRISQRLKSIVENLLALNRYANHQLACEDVLDLNQVVERLCEGYEQSRIGLRLAPELPILVSNLSALESIIVNLLRNALQHSPDNSAIEIGTSITTHGQPKLYVKNQLLHPLSEDELSHVFEPLWQKDAARTSDENFGLGLSISQALAAAIQSTLYVESDSTHIVFVLECFSNKR